MRFVEKTYGKRFSEYPELYRWSVDCPEEFWAAAWDFFGVVASSRFTAAVEHVDSFRDVQWFPGAKLNYTENMLKYSDLKTPAIIFRGEAAQRREISRAQLRDEVLRMARALEREGVRAGDVVAAYLPNLPETIIAMLAVSAIGAIWCSCATDMGQRPSNRSAGGSVGLLHRSGITQRETFDVLANPRR